MKLIQVCATLKRSIGGPAKVAKDLNKLLHPDFDVVTLVFGPSEVFRESIVSAPSVFGNRYGLVLSPMLRTFHGHIKNADVLLIHGYYLFSTLFALFFSSCDRIFIMPHGSLEIYQEKRRRVRKFLYNLIAARAFRRKTIKWLVASESEKVSVQSKFPKAMVIVVGIGINLQDFPVIECNWDHFDKIGLFTFSRISEKKRIDVCIDLISFLNQNNNQFHLDIVGEGEASLIAKLKHQSEELNLTEYVKFYGPVDRISEIDFRYKLPIFLLVSENENFAIAVSEVIASGIPVIVTNMVAMHTFVELHKAGIVINQISITDLANAITEVIDNYQFYRSNCIKSSNLLGWSTIIADWKHTLAN